jgi:Putative lumazine-binding
MKKYSLLLAVLFAFQVSAFSQSSSIWTVDLVKSNEGQQKNLLNFYDQNWAKARQILKEKGKIISFRVLSFPPGKNLTWDIMLMTEYANRETFDARETLIAEIFKNRQTVLINGLTGRQMSKIINPDLGYNEPISSEKAKEIINKIEIEAVKIPLENYIKGQATGNGNFIRQAFHKDARITAFRDGKLLNLSVEEFAGRFNGKSADDESKRKRSFEILEISGDAAIARVTLDYPTIKFTDYMSLLKIDGEWKIINKNFYGEAKTKK